MNKLNICNLCLVDFGHNLNKTRQRLSDVILQEGDGPTVIPTLAKKITSELAEVRIVVPGDAPPELSNEITNILKCWCHRCKGYHENPSLGRICESSRLKRNM